MMTLWWWQFRLVSNIRHQHRLVDWWRKFWKFSSIDCVKYPVIKDHLVLSDFLSREKSLSSHMSVKLSVLNYLWTVETKRLKSETETNYMQQVHKLFIPSDPQGPSYKPVYLILYNLKHCPYPQQSHVTYDMNHMINTIRARFNIIWKKRV